MKYAVPLLFVVACLICGCATSGPATLKMLVSPAQAAYDHADGHLQKQDYPGAIAAFEKFILSYPRSNLVPGAYLGIAWSHYLTGNYKETLDALAKVRTQDQGLKEWIEKLKTDAQKRFAASPEATATPTLFNIPAFTNQEALKIEGTAPQGGRVLVNDQEAQVNQGVFSYALKLQPGENAITVVTIGQEGKPETKTAKVILDTAPPQIKVTSAEVDDFGYVALQGTTKPGAKITVDNEPLNVDAQGNFDGRVKAPRDKTIRLVALDAAGNSASETFSDTSYPDRPTGLRLRAQTGVNVELEWDSNREADLKGYNVYYAQAGGSISDKNNRETVTGTTYSMENLQAGKTYSVQIRAVDKMGNESEPSRETLSVTIP